MKEIAPEPITVQELSRNAHLPERSIRPWLDAFVERGLLLSEFFHGATMLAAAGVALFFLRFWRRTGDRFFAVFAAAFAVFAVNRLLLVVLAEDSEARTWVYVLRATMFVMIAAAIVDKNYGRQASSTD